MFLSCMLGHNGGYFALVVMVMSHAVTLRSGFHPSPPHVSLREAVTVPQIVSSEFLILVVFDSFFSFDFDIL